MPKKPGYHEAGEVNIIKRKNVQAGRYATLGGRYYNEYATRLVFGRLYQLFEAKPNPLVTPSMNFSSGVDLTNAPIVPMEQGPIIVDPDYGSGTADGTIVEVSTDPTFTDPTQTVYSYNGPPVETLNIPSTLINPTETPDVFYMRVRNTAGVYLSPWSNPVSFTLATVIFINKPVIQAENYRLIHATQMTWTGTGNFIHGKSDWEVALDSGFASIVFTSYNDTINLTDILLASLTAGNTYYVRVRYHTTTGLTSQWSDPFQFHAESFIMPPTIIYPTFTDNGTNSIVVSEHDNVNTPYPNPRMIIEWRYSDDSGVTWSSWTLLNQAYNDTGIYDVYLEQTPSGGTRRFEVRCRYRKYVGPAATDYVYSAYSNTYSTEFSDTDYAASGGYLGSGNTYVSYAVTPYAVWYTFPVFDPGKSGDTILYEFYDDRALTNLVETATRPMVSGNAGKFFTSLKYQKLLNNSNFTLVPDTGLYVRARAYNSTTMEHGTWSTVRYLPFGINDHVHPYDIQIGLPVDGSTGHTSAMIQSTPAGPSTIFTSNKKAFHIGFKGITLELGTALNYAGTPTNLVEQYFNEYPSPSNCYRYFTAELQPNTTYYARMKYTYDPDHPSVSKWGPTISFTTGSTIETPAPPKVIKIGGQVPLGTFRNPFFYIEDLVDLTSYPGNGGMVLRYVVIDNTTGDLIENVSAEINTNIKKHAVIAFSKDRFEIGKSYTLRWRHQLHQGSYNVSVPKASIWQDFVFTPNLESLAIYESSPGTAYNRNMCFYDPSANNMVVLRRNTYNTLIYRSGIDEFSGFTHKHTITWRGGKFAHNKTRNRIELFRAWRYQPTFSSPYIHRIELSHYDLATDTVTVSPIDFEGWVAAECGQALQKVSMRLSEICYDPFTGRMFVYGGGSHCLGLNFLLSYDNDTASITRHADCPEVIYGGTMVPDGNGTIYKFGGRTQEWEPSYANRRVFSLWKYDIATDTWTQLNDMPYKAGFVKAYYIPAGPNTAEGILVTAMDVKFTVPRWFMWYDIATDTWDKLLYSSNVSSMNIQGDIVPSQSKLIFKLTHWFNGLTKKYVDVSLPFPA